MAKDKPKKLARRQLKYGNVYVAAGNNNTIITLADEQGATICQTSAGASGFKGSRKSTPYAAQVAAEKACEVAKMSGIEEVKVYVKGIGNGREQAIRGIIGAGIEVSAIVDRTPVPHGGCRKCGPRRV